MNFRQSFYNLADAMLLA